MPISIFLLVDHITNKQLQLIPKKFKNKFYLTIILSLNWINNFFLNFSHEKLSLFMDFPRDFPTGTNKKKIKYIFFLKKKQNIPFFKIKYFKTFRIPA